MVVIGWFVDVNKDYFLVTEENGKMWAQSTDGNTSPIYGTPAQYGLKPDETGYPFAS